MTVQQNISTARARTQELRALPLDGAADRAVDTSVQVAPLVTTPNALGYLKKLSTDAPLTVVGPASGGSLRWGLVDKDDIWYLIGGTENGQRTFRVDRIAEAEVTAELAERRSDFDLP